MIRSFFGSLGQGWDRTKGYGDRWNLVLNFSNKMAKVVENMPVNFFMNSSEDLFTNSSEKNLLKNNINDKKFNFYIDVSTKRLQLTVTN